MPKSKRDKIVSLTKVKKKGREIKNSLVEEIRKCIEKYERIFVFSAENMRSSKLNDVRQRFKANSRFFFGKNKVMSLAVGRIPEEEQAEGLHSLSKHLLGQRGLLFTNAPAEEVIQYFKDFSASDFARSGNRVGETIVLEAGLLEHYPFNMEPQFRKLGLPTALKKGEIHLLEEYTVCKAGQQITPEQAKILKLLNYEMAKFRLNLICVWEKSDHSFKSLSPQKKKKPAVPKSSKTPASSGKGKKLKTKTKASQKDKPEEENMETE